MLEYFSKNSWEIPGFEIHEFNKKINEYCVCIPVINEGNRIRNQLEIMLELGIYNKADIIICDGGSTDNSLDHALLKSVYVNTLLVKTGAGKLSAQLRMGFGYALWRGYKGIVTIDGNNKDYPAAIPNFIYELEKGGKYIQGSRFVLGGKAINTPPSRYLAIRLIHAPFISLAAKYHYTDTTNGFRGYHKDVLLDDQVKPFRKIFDTYEILAYLSIRPSSLGYKTKEIPVARGYPAAGKIPSKVHGLSGNIELLRILFSAVLGRYNP